ncbi:MULTISPECIES: hypothetical protein [Streptomyces phaeochromogenes group]|uniref:hypothetical protein n=1 Tax=Streptomyces phaeochromogenes group TaxID=2838332 RepID=UPI0033F722F7|nr:hypothetical protein OHB08_32000 [Streptomyces phaeochromogenes]
MRFSASFDQAVPSGAVAPASESLEHGGDYENLVMEACSALSDAGDSAFHIGGFGSDEWPLDVEYGLAAFMEQLPSPLVGVRECREVEVDL